MSTCISPFEDKDALAEYAEDLLYTHAGRIDNICCDHWVFSCPLCGEGHSGSRKRRGNWYRQTATYRCFNAGCIGDSGLSALRLTACLKNVDQAHENVEYIKWYNKTRKKGDVNDISELNEPKQIAAIQQSSRSMSVDSELMEDTWVSLPSAVKDYCEQRKIFSAPFAPKNWNLYFDIATKRLVIPWTNSLTGKIEYWQKRLLVGGRDETKYLYPAGMKRPVFGIDAISDDWPYIILLEGCLDAIHVYNGVAIGGLTPSEDQMKIIKERHPGKMLVVFVDNPFVDKSAKIALCGDYHSGVKGLIYKHQMDRKFLLPPKTMKYKDVNEAIINEPQNYPFHDRAWLEKNMFNALQAKILLSS